MRRRTSLLYTLALTVFLAVSVKPLLEGQTKASSSPNLSGPNLVAPMLIDDFEDSDLISAIGTKWFTFNDNSLGGKSEMAMALVSGGAKGSKKSLRLTGKVTTDFKYGGFAGLRMLFDESGKVVKDLTPYTGLQFYARGDGRQYRVEVMTAAVKDHSEYGKEFPAGKGWTLYKIPFSELAQPQEFGRKVKWTGTDVRGVVFMTSGFPIESFSFQVDEISFY